MQTIDFFIADTHGESVLLMQLLSFLQRHARSRGAEPRYTFLGDLVDRGPDSKGCVETAIRTIQRHEGSVLLLGNHEYMMLDALDSNGKSELSGSWALNGGMATVESYMGKLDIKGMFPALKANFGHHVAAIRNASLSVERHGLLAVHAGIEWTMDLADQGVDILAGIRDMKPYSNFREKFLAHVDPKARPVIHGHTIIGMRPEVTENRISIDTGASRNGRLTACIVDPDTWDISFAQSTEAGVRYIEARRLDRGFGTLLDDPKRVFEAYRSTSAENGVQAASSLSIG
ncbi:metallophosphoesterase [Rhizobium sp. BK176]|uniref:metallophosphoesterase n=1 Tax=Rhizobium sp. BK176 TaxID=2587071 RepID=UPI002169CA42|nr:metallophosphoesterase [Rhizobium sp. BK176]MCS4088736.1 serine/threonine protein phosphatase 1 [Rhizobium sp. BK176]